MKRMKKRYKKFLIPILGVILGILLAICVGALNAKDDEKDEQLNQQNEDVLQDEVAFYKIDTKYCDLYFPKQWKKQIEVKFKKENGYKVKFYGTVKGKNAQHLFDVCFNSDDGELLGYLEEDKEIVNISIDVMQLKFDDNWTQEEMDQIYSMQEEMNFVIDALSKNDNYVEP